MKKMILVQVDIYEKYFPKPPILSSPDLETKLQQQASFMHEMPVQQTTKVQPLQLPLNLDFIERIDIKYRQRARHLVAHLKENIERIQWTDFGELVYHGQPIPNSHIADLLYDLSKPVSAKRPVGSWEFLKLLKQTNVPKQYIADKVRINEMDAERIKFDEEIVSPRIAQDELLPLPQRPPVPLVQRPPVNKRVLKRQKPGRPKWNPY
jgi:hypothetical protein